MKSSSYSSQVIKDHGPNKRSNSDTAETTHLGTNHPCYLFDVIATNLTEGTLYLLVFDAAAVPDDNTAPTLPPVQVPASHTGSFSYVKGRKMMNGIAMCLSSTPTVKSTQGVDAAGWFDVTYF